jgi:Methyltransferase domain
MARNEGSQRFKHFSSSRWVERGFFVLVVSALAMIRDKQSCKQSTLLQNALQSDEQALSYYKFNNSGSNSVLSLNGSGFELAYRESLGFFTDIPDSLWLPRKALSKGRVHNSGGKKNFRNPIGTYYQMNWDPDFACLLEDSVGDEFADGHKWICDPHRLASQPDCLVYSIGSNGQFEFETHLNRIAPNCQIHIFDPDDFSKELASLSMQNVTFHAWGLKASYHTNPNHIKSDSFDPTKHEFSDSVIFRTLAETLKILGHQGRRIDVFKIDCEGCEWGAYKDLLQQDLRQIVVEVHGVSKVTNQFFQDFHEQGYVIFHKEPNIEWASGNCVEFSFLKLSKEFFQ